MKGVIAAGSEYAAEAGGATFRLGGNAVDAAVAAAWASFVAEMSLVNIAGGGYATVWSAAANGSASFYDFFCAMPSGEVNEKMDFRGIEIDFGTERQNFHIGRASSAIPGVVAGLCQLNREGGRLPLGQVLAPAISLAEKGFSVSSSMADILHLLKPIFGNTAPVRAMFTTGRRWINSGDHVRFPQLAKTLRTLCREGADSFYKGSLGEALVSDQAKGGGLIRAQDLGNYRVVRSEPAKMIYRDGEVLLPVFSSLGGSLIGLSLSLLQSQPLGKMVMGSAEHLRVWAHGLRLTSEARHHVVQAVAPDSTRAASRLPAALLTHYCSLLKKALTTPTRFQVYQEPAGPSHTSHISAIDGEGTAVSLTTSAGESAGYLIPGTGMLMNNVLGEEDLNPGGFHRHPMGQRLQSMMSPILFCRAGQPVLALGSAGSNRLRSAILQTLSYMVDFGLDLDEAVNAPRIHYENGLLQIEGGFEEQAIGALVADGFEVRQWQGTHLFFGGVQAVAAFGGGFQAGADHRRGGGVRFVLD